ncbi:protein kinase family protein [Selenihalanaerobacter shriftii]|uniref:Serine/threonine protein kinase n=1 Tax=Selenihalanaerobacter shriftii TaxID=142842 RepID=A0A1T4MM24_9FIRM|nr:protein kinase family protein [Selenihalanaerobacter shriftii]SJZ67778.1 serine/threonine protein kinase [Selenihalanaerobacter shriftii]
MELKKDSIIEFNQSKKYIFKKHIGQGGTGKTILVEDIITNFDFVCKKYSPYDEGMQDEYFERFIEEIKIMHPIFHENIVRIYNYDLYPEQKTGYIFMEYIDGTPIDAYLTFENNDVFENIFIQLIEGFDYLQRNAILHRDIRNKNILVTNDGVLKIIDFGFGKKINMSSKEKASIILNWPVTEFPDEINDSEYNHQTEVYFVGKTFNKILKQNNINNFRYQHIINEMINLNPEYRIKSFSNVLEEISKDIFDKYSFIDDERYIYLRFADSLTNNIIKMRDEIELVQDSKEIIRSLEEIINECLLEEFLQDNSKLISCFVKNAYTYSTRNNIEVECIRDFYEFFKKLSISKREIVLNNINSRLKNVKIEYDDVEVPF